MLDQFMITKSLVSENKGHIFLKASVYSKKYMINPKEGMKATHSKVLPSESF